jgi:hypothetical protein
MVDSEAMFVRLLGRFRTQSTAWPDERITVKKPVNLGLDRESDAAHDREQQHHQRNNF